MAERRASGSDEAGAASADPRTEPTEIGSTLGRALHARLDGSPVDSGLLLEGARQGAVDRRRRRRAALVVGAAAALLVPVGVMTAQGLQGDRGPVTAGAGDVLLREDDRGAEPGGTPSGGPSGTASDDPLPGGSEPTAPASGPTGATGGTLEEPTTASGPTGSVLGAMPGSIPSPLLEPEDLPVPMVLELSIATVKLPTLPGQACNEDRPGLEPFDGQIESWAEDFGNSRDQQSVNVSVTRWAPGDAAMAFDEVEQDTGRCRFQDEGDVLSWQPSTGQEGLQRNREYEGLDFAAALLRSGDLLVGVELVGADGTEGLQEGSADVAESVALRLEAAGAVGPER